MSTDTAATSPKDPRVAEAVRLWLKSPALTVEQVMLAAKFRPDDAANRNCQMWVRRRTPKKKEMRKPSSVEARSVESAVSSLTESSPEVKKDGGRGQKRKPAHPMPQPARKRRTTKKLQEDRIAEKLLGDHKKEAHKAATLLYAERSRKRMECRPRMYAT